KESNQPNDVPVETQPLCEMIGLHRRTTGRRKRDQTPTQRNKLETGWHQQLITGMSKENVYNDTCDKKKRYPKRKLEWVRQKLYTDSTSCNGELTILTTYIKPDRDNLLYNLLRTDIFQ
ncbi:8292_t:CDS:2, partial [Acaulospora morrowiae]